MIKLKYLIPAIALTILTPCILPQSIFAQTVQKDETALEKGKDYYFLDGVKAYTQADYRSAKEAFIKVLEFDPQNDAAYYYLSNISLNNNDVTSGEMLLKKAIEIDTTNYWYKGLLARIYLSTKRPEEAIKIYEGLITQFPKKTDIYYNLVNLYLNQEDVTKSNEVLDKIEQIAGKSEATIMTRFNLYRMAHDWDGALQYLIEADKEIQSPRIETMIGDMYADRYKDSVAMEYYDKALITEAGYAPAIFGQAELYRKKGDYNLFFEKVSPFIANPAVDAGMKSEYIGQLFQAPGFMQKFKPQLDTLMENLTRSHPADSTVTYLASAYFVQTGNAPMSQQLLKQNYQLYPDNFEAAFRYLTFLYYQSNWESLEKEASVILNRFPENTDLIQLLGISQFQNKNLDNAIATYKKLEEISLKNKDTSNLLTCYSLLGDLYHENNNSKYAYANYKKALKIDPNYNPVLNNYAYYLALENKNLKLAYQMSKKTIETEPDNPTYLDTFAWILFLMDKPIEAKAQLKHAMLYGGKESAAILDHYAEILFALKEYDLAFIYWEQAKTLDNTLGIDEKMKERKTQMNNLNKK